jgi:hypothetical protein
LDNKKLGHLKRQLFKKKQQCKGGERKDESAEPECTRLANASGLAGYSLPQGHRKQDSAKKLAIKSYRMEDTTEEATW